MIDRYLGSGMMCRMGFLVL